MSPSLHAKDTTSILDALFLGVLHEIGSGSGSVLVCKIVLQDERLLRACMGPTYLPSQCLGWVCYRHVDTARADATDRPR